MNYSTCIKTPGLAVPLLGEPLGFLGDAKWQVTEASRRVLSPDNYSIHVDGVIVGEVNYQISLLTGTVTFTSNIPADTAVVVFTGDFLPMGHVAGANKYTLSADASAEDVTSFEDLDPELLAANQIPSRVYVAGTADVKATLESVINIDDALWLKSMIAGSSVMLQLVEDANHYSVGWFDVVGDARNSAAAISRETVSFVLSGELEHVVI